MKLWNMQDGEAAKVQLIGKLPDKHCCSIGGFAFSIHEPVRQRDFVRLTRPGVRDRAPRK